MSFLARKVQKGLLNCGTLDAIAAEIGAGPLATSSGHQRPDCEQLAYQLELRFSKASKPTRVYWPSLEFAREYGSWTGSEDYACPHKVSHDLLISQVWLRLLAKNREQAVHNWIPERQLQFESRHSAGHGPIPDALIIGGDKPLAIEIGGNYPASWIAHHVSRFEAAGWDWQIW